MTFPRKQTHLQNRALLPTLPFTRIRLLRKTYSQALPLTRGILVETRSLLDKKRTKQTRFTYKIALNNYKPTTKLTNPYVFPLTKKRKTQTQHLVQVIMTPSLVMKRLNTVTWEVLRQKKKSLAPILFFLLSSLRVCKAMLRQAGNALSLATRKNTRSMSSRTHAYNTGMAIYPSARLTQEKTVGYPLAKLEQIVNIAAYIRVTLLLMDPTFLSLLRLKKIMAMAWYSLAPYRLALSSGASPSQVKIRSLPQK